MFSFNQISFKFFKKKETLIIDESRKLTTFGLKEAEFINPRNIYCIYLFKSIIKNLFKFQISLKKIKQHYLISIISSVQPRIVIGNNINGFIFKIKNISSEIISIMYQHSYIYDFEINDFKKLYQDKIVDYFLVFDERHKMIFQNILKSEYIISGSILNNEIKIKYEKKYIDILFISEFREKNPQFKIDIEKKVVKFLSNYAKKNNLNFYIALNGIRKDKTIDVQKEINFYKNMNIKFFYEKNKNSYDLASISKLIINISSNIGLELLSRNYKVLFLNLMYEYNIMFKNPYYFEEIFCLELNEKEITKKINFLLKINNQEYLKIIKKHNLMNYNSSNKKLSNLFSKFNIK